MLFSPEFFRHIEISRVEIRAKVDGGQYMNSKRCESYTEKFIERPEKARFSSIMLRT